jgi:hypothetical protein
LYTYNLVCKCYEIFSDEVMIAKLPNLWICMYVWLGLELIVVEYNYSFLSDLVEIFSNQVHIIVAVI